MKKIKYLKILSYSCIAMIAFTFTGCADHTAYDKTETAQQTPMQIPESETDNAMPESGDNIQKPQSDMPKEEETPEESTKPDMKSEPETEFPSESDTTSENDEPVSITQIDYDSFQSQMTKEEWEGFQQYFPVLKKNAAFELTSFDYDNYTLFDKDGKVTENETNAVLRKYNSKEMTDMDRYVKADAESSIEELTVYKVQVFDLDRDGIQELILEWEPLGDFLILHRENEAFYGWETVCRGFEVLQTSGVYISSGGAACNHWQRLRFNQGNWIEESLAVQDWEEYYINGEAVDEDTFWQQVHSYETGDVTTYKPKQYTDKVLNE